MRKKIMIAATMIFACLTGSSSGQQRPKRKAVIMPAGVVFTSIIANQPNCPLKFDNVLMIKYLDGAQSERFDLRNSGSKPIRTYTIAVWTSNGTGSIDEQKQIRNGLLLPGQKMPDSDGAGDIEIVPMTDELREKLRLRGPMKAVSVFMVVRLEFEDGSVYSDEPTFEALQEYFEKVGARVFINQGH